jgi:LPXTG-motif cell wall-anchored protein
MLRKILLVLVLMGLVLVPASVLAQDDTVTVTLSEQSGSGISGTATLTQMGDDLRVVVDVDGTEAGSSHPAHIHTGACPNPGGVAHPLEAVEDGTSTTTLAGIELSSVTDGNHAINLHLSADDLDTYVACGDIPEAEMAAATATDAMDAAEATATPAAQPEALPKTGGDNTLPWLLALGALAAAGGLLLRRAS